MIRHVLHSVREMESLGEAFGQALAPGCVVGLSGDLGSGKTAFVRGLARGVGSGARVHSPTFALLHEYEGGRCPVHHLDLYRLAGAAEVRAAGLEDYLLRPRGITAVEWVERWEDPLPVMKRLRFRWIDDGTREVMDDMPGA
jgi:tRNA threonylcarbamoyladenosine biosynthesis protein TsaE